MHFYASQDKSILPSGFNFSSQKRRLQKYEFREAKIAVA